MDPEGSSFESCLAAWVVQTDWWPRGLGLQVDQQSLRHEFEPAEGARVWLQVEQQGDEWTSQHSFAYSKQLLPLLLHELREQVQGVSAAALSRLPVDELEVSRLLSDDISRSLAAIRDARPLAPWRGGRVVARPPAGRLEPGESLSPEVVVRASGTARARVSSTQADVARRIGALLLQRFDWTRPVALEREPFERLTQALEEASSSLVRWSLRAGNESGSVDLLLHEAGQVRSLGSVLKQGPHAGGARMFRPDPSDDMQLKWNYLDHAHNGAPTVTGRVMVQGDVALDPSKAFDGIDPQGRVIVLGHGDPGGWWHEATVGGLTARQLASQLVDQGLAKDFAGTVYLDSCSSGNGLGRRQAFSNQLQRALGERGLRGVAVAGQPGVSRGRLGTSQVAPSELVLNGAATVRRTDRLIGHLERQRRQFDEVAAKASRAGRVDEAAAARAEASLHGRLARQEKAYRDRIVELNRGAKLAAEIAGIEAMQAPFPSEQKPPLHRRLFDGIRRLFSSSPPADQIQVEQQRVIAFHLETLRSTGVRNMWGFFGPAPAGRMKR